MKDKNIKQFLYLMAEGKWLQQIVISLKILAKIVYSYV
jgi:hypothetical protein